MADPPPQEEGHARQEEGEIHALITQIATSSPECSARVRYTIADPPPLSEKDSRQEGGECMFFNLPAELRNYIYELAFDGNSEESIALLSAAPPSKAMVLTCRQAYNEAAAIHRFAYRRFWTTNRFELKVNYNTRLGETQAAFWSKPPPRQLPPGELALDWVITTLGEVPLEVCSDREQIHNLRIRDCPGMSDCVT
ncbi:hypothetical protein LTR12_001567 [Friedmanniomyces endolithicus]|nr:hypothetical protein LTR12_001567 [Friedmanniomyces endolithicus]